MNFLNPWVLTAIPLALAILIWLLRSNYVQLDTRYADEQQSQKQLHKRRRWFFISRALTITLLITALAGPVIYLEDFIETDPQITVLQDTSASMDVLETAQAEQLIQEIRDRVPVQVHTIGSENTSALGDDILAQLRSGRNLLLITDGQVTTGASLANVASFASSIDATLNALHLPVQQADASVSITGPNYVIEEMASEWQIHVQTTTQEPVLLRVYVNEEEITEEYVSDQTIQLQRSFDQGEHEIRAEISADYGREENNQFIQTVTATSKPRVLYVTQKQSGLETIIQEFYDIEKRTNIPRDLDEYYAVILNDLPLTALRNSEQQLISYAAQGNGVFVVGGENSFDQGGYQNSVLETLLPVRVGTGERTRGGANIVVAMDLSGRTLGERYVDGELVQVEQAQDTQKALAIDLIEQLNPSNRVAALAFTHPVPNVRHCTGACVIQRLEPLANTREELIDKIARVNITGGTSLSRGLQGGIQLLEGVSGSKNIIFISDGVSGTEDQQQALNAARTLAAQGGTVYSVLVGSSDRGVDFMQALAQAGEGVFFRADRTNRVAALFGEPVDLSEEDAFEVVAINEHHFITQELPIQATLFGYNQVTPRRASQLLVASNAGDPVLTTWNYGVGRVAALTAYNGADLGQLLHEPTSQLLTRTTNWVIGDPQRKQTTSMRLPDGRLGEDIRLNITSPTRPQAPGVDFERVDSNEYRGVLTPTQSGVFELLGASYAVNYPREMELLGVSDALQEAVELTGGRMFSQPSAEEVIEHAKELSRLKQTDQEPVRWPFILAALTVFFVEVVVRRIQAIRRRR